MQRQILNIEVRIITVVFTRRSSAKPKRVAPALAGHLPQLITNQRPMLDQLIFIDLHDHARTLLAHPITRRADTRLRLVTASLPTPLTRSSTARSRPRCVRREVSWI